MNKKDYLSILWLEICNTGKKTVVRQYSINELLMIGNKNQRIKSPHIIPIKGSFCPSDNIFSLVQISL
jgi:hypothetical protein